MHVCMLQCIREFMALSEQKTQSIILLILLVQCKLDFNLKVQYLQIQFKQNLSSCLQPAQKYKLK